METPTLTVVARFEAKPGRENDVRQALVRMVEPTIQEEGNIGYALHQSADDPRSLVLYEQWRDDNALTHHMHQPYFAQMDRELDGALVRPYEVLKLRPIAGETSPAAFGP